MKDDFSDSSLFQQLTSESAEIEKLKWVESEKARYDIGINRAILIWIRNHRSDWIKSHYDGNFPP